MKSISLLLLFTAISGFSNAQLRADSKENLYDHLFEVNQEWQHYASNVTEIEIAFDNDLDRISKHLELVEEVLSARDVSNLGKKQIENRTELLAELREYAAKKVFPTNLYHSKRTPYFIDDYGVHCAVGYLIFQSGHGDLAQQIRAEHNYDYIRNIKTEGVTEWANENGFTLDELAWIQPGYQAPGTYNTMGQGTNGTVKAMAKDAVTGRIYMAGEFTELEGGNTCGSVAYYENDQLYCLGGGLVMDSVNDLFFENGKVIVTGKIQANGMSYPMAEYENGSWNFIEIPNRANYTALTSIQGMGSIIDQQVVIYDQSSSVYEIWSLSASNWTLVAATNGPVHSIAWHESEIVYAGRFDTLAFFTQGSTALPTENIAVYDLGTQNWTAPTGQIADEIFKVKWFNGNFFFGGRATYHIDQAFNSFGTFHNDTISAIYGASIYSQGQSPYVTIYDFETVGDSSVIVCGEFAAGFMYFGNRIARIDYTQFNSNVDLGYPNETAWIEAKGDLGLANPYALAVHQSELFVGGEIPSLKNAVKFDESVNLDEIGPFSGMVYPNPSSDMIYFEMDQSIESITIYDLNGKICHQQKGSNSVNVSDYKSGEYLVKIHYDHGITSETNFIKQ